jgi:hypothetical protein
MPECVPARQLLWRLILYEKIRRLFDTNHLHVALLFGSEWTDFEIAVKSLGAIGNPKFFGAMGSSASSAIGPAVTPSMRFVPTGQIRSVGVPFPNVARPRTVQQVATTFGFPFRLIAECWNDQ